ncbi:MAG: hypothetical protein F6K24_18075 [Okeania sp. SIO2D1]|nr:hypothetical protein [Okeania sp. SIO2D1]
MSLRKSCFLEENFLETENYQLSFKLFDSPIKPNHQKKAVIEVVCKNNSILISYLTPFVGGMFNYAMDTENAYYLEETSLVLEVLAKLETDSKSIDEVSSFIILMTIYVDSVEVHMNNKCFQEITPKLKEEYESDRAIWLKLQEMRSLGLRTSVDNALNEFRESGLIQLAHKYLNKPQQS